jgi:hypothetical protein
MEQLHQVLADVVWTPFAGGLVFRPFVIELSPEDAVCGFVPHHAVMDYYGCQILAREIRGELLGEAEDSVGERRVQYADYLQDLAGWIAGTEANQRLEYWRECMRDAPDTYLPEARHVESGTVSLIDCLLFDIAPRLRANLASAARSCSSSLAAVMMAVNYIALAATLRRDDIVSRVLVSGRDTPSLLGLVGNTVDCFPVRAWVNRRDLFPTFAQQLQATFVRGCRHRVKWEAVKEVMRDVGAGAIAPTFNWVIEVERPVQAVSAAESQSGLGLEPMEVRRPPELASASLHKSHHMGLFDTGQQVHGHIAYMPVRHNKASIDTFVDRFLGYLTAVAENPFVSIGRLTQSDWARVVSVTSG